MNRESDRAIVHRGYTRWVLAAAQVSDVRVGQAFVSVCRQDFLGAGPRPILRWFRFFVPTPGYSGDPVGIVPERRINNGQPSLQAWWRKRESKKATLSSMSAQAPATAPQSWPIAADRQTV